ncbi:MAG: PxKF domain-containing protein [Anaerolineae bacterium]|nr:PxKF domain-containing protein [Anaerolineae bacterium]
MKKILGTFLLGFIFLFNATFSARAVSNSYTAPLEYRTIYSGSYNASLGGAAGTYLNGDIYKTISVVNLSGLPADAVITGGSLNFSASGGCTTSDDYLVGVYRAISPNMINYNFSGWVQAGSDTGYSETPMGTAGIFSGTISLSADELTSLYHDNRGIILRSLDSTPGHYCPVQLGSITIHYDVPFPESGTPTTQDYFWQNSCAYTVVGADCLYDPQMGSYDGNISVATLTADWTDIPQNLLSATLEFYYSPTSSLSTPYIYIGSEPHGTDIATQVIVPGVNNIPLSVTALRAASHIYITEAGYRTVGALAPYAPLQNYKLSLTYASPSITATDTLTSTNVPSFTTYDAFADFSPVSNPPSGSSWTYGYTWTLGGAFDIYTALRHDIDRELSILWTRPENFITPNVNKNISGMDIINVDGCILHPAVTYLNLHPGQNNEFSVLRWTAPVDGTFMIDSAFKSLRFCGQATTTDAHVLYNSTSIFDLMINEYMAAGEHLFSSTLNLNAGDTIDFVVGVGQNGNYGADSTGVRATISLISTLPSATPTYTFTPTFISTNTPTLTIAPSLTATDTSIPTVTPSYTATDTPTATPILFNFTGFFQPVDNLPILNVVKAGKGVIVKFSLGGYHGLNIFANGYPTSSHVACGSTAEDAIEQTFTFSSNSLMYDSNADQYLYKWKTEDAWAGTCRTLVFKLSDGTYHRVNFYFK